MAKTLQIEVTVGENKEEFDKVVAEMQQHYPHAKLLVYLFGANKQETGKSWCPDCVVSEPLLDKLLKEFREKYVDYVLIRCPIEREGYKGNSQHPFRVHNKIKLQSIPTLIWWENNSTSERVVENEFTQGNTLKQFTEKLTNKE